jgi:UDP-N-acetylglucosamine--N-acetylmuramyl-(pentapeptide) pyrophosphoryl-undecaprenol N-acetylglucosamine transferase
MNAANGPVVLATGGTGGHVFPAQSLAGALIERGLRIVVVTDGRGRVAGDALERAQIYRISASGVSGRNIFRRIAATVLLGAGFYQARKILQPLHPAVVVGFGSYASLPTMAAAVHLHYRTIIHEQNAILGRANRLLASRVTRVATAFRTVAKLRREDQKKAVWTGNPVRPEIVSIAGRPYPPLEEGGTLSVLVFGGSQGATIFSDIVPATLAGLPETLRARLRVVQQCRAEDIEAVRRVYAICGLDVELAPFFADLPEKLAAAHLVICRAGASTIAELSAAGRPAILVPYPHAIDDHQTKNAEGLCDAGGGWMIPQNAFNRESLGARLTALLSNTRMLHTAALCAGRVGMRTATANLADLVIDVIRSTESNATRQIDGASQEAVQ